MPVAVREVASVPASLYLIGKESDPLAWPAQRERAGPNRFDDPLNQFRALYAAEQRIACFVETLAGFRPSIVRRDHSGRIGNGVAWCLRR